MDSNLEYFLADPYDFLESASIKDLVEIAKQADIFYYNNDEPIISDQEYDLIIDRIKELDPSNAYLAKPAHTQIELTQTITNKKKTTLPYTMGSMNKLKPQDVQQINTFKSSYPEPWIISDKLDGVSALYIVEPGKDPQLYTRGNGTIGTIISNLIPLISIPKLKSNLKTTIVVRGELIMSKKAFTKYSDKMANARNMVAGIVNAKTVDKSKAKDIDFIAYEMIEPWDTYTSQFTQLKKYGFDVVCHSLINEFDIDLLKNKLRERKSDSPYECDGIIIASNSPTERVNLGNPPYAFAFKNLDELETSIVRVTKVQWNVSKDRYLKPKLILNPTKLSGVTIKNVTAFNAKYVWNNLLGPGAEIVLVRSGDVIPHILKVHKPATSGEPDFPPEDTYEWNETEVDIIAIEGSTQHVVKELTYFCSKLDIANLSEGNIAKLIDAGIDTIPKLLVVTKAELASVEGFKEKMIEKIYTEIKSKVQSMSLLQFMTGSNAFGHGMGERKIKKVLTTHPDIIFQYIEKKTSVLITQLSHIEGFEKITATKFIKGMKKFLELLNQIPEQIQNRLLLDIDLEYDKQSGTKLQGIKVVFSGFRDKSWEKIILSQSGEVSTSISKNTKILVTTSEAIKENKNDKLVKALQLGIKVMSKEEFESYYIK